MCFNRLSERTIPLTIFWTIIIIWHRNVFNRFEEVDMKYLAGMLLGMMIFASAAMADSTRITNYNYSPSDALHPFKLISLAMRPPLGVATLFVKGTYWVLDVDPINRAFNIESDPSMNIDADY